MSEMEKLFGKPIYTYTAQQAVEDGYLVAVTERDLVTRSVWNLLVAKTPLGSEPPDRWPVEMMGWFRAGSITQKDALKMIAKHGIEAQKKYEEKIRHDKALALAKGLIGSHDRQAKQSEDAGRTYMLYALETNDVLSGLRTEQPVGTGFDQKFTTMYLRPNECGGVTLLLPEDD
jgi:hypothetical protein